MVLQQGKEIGYRVWSDGIYHNYMGRRLIISLYKSLVMPYLEYFIQVWTPFVIQVGARTEEDN